MRTDLRYIKGAPHGISAPNSWVKRGASLCGYCAAEPFCDALNQKPRPVYTGCSDYMPPLTFQDKTGLHHNGFSTIRLGKAWGERLSAIYGIVALVHKTKTKQTVLGFARVECHRTLPKDQAIALSEHNHLLIDRPGTKEQKLDFLRKTIRRYYGGFDQEGTKPYTVIVLKRLTDDESEGFKTAWPMGHIPGD